MAACNYLVGEETEKWVDEVTECGKTASRAVRVAPQEFPESTRWTAYCEDHAQELLNSPVDGAEWAQDEWLTVEAAEAKYGPQR